MAHPRITTITVTLDQQSFLERSICSVLDQGYDNLEYFVVDGGSSDDSAGVIRAYSDELEDWHSEPFSGPAQAANWAIQRATGDYIAVMHGDDLLLPGALEKVAAAVAAQHGAPAWLTGDCFNVGERDEERGRLTAAAPKSLAGFLKHDSGLMPRPGTFYSRQLLLDKGGFDASLRFAYDYAMHCHLLQRGIEPTIVPGVLGAHRETVAQSVEHVLERGREFVEVAHRHACRLPLGARYQLWRNCDERRRIYALAEAEAGRSDAKRVLWQRLLCRPWWLASDCYRHMLLHGAGESIQQVLGRATGHSDVRHAA